MARQCQRQILAVDTIAVVAYAHQLDATGFQFDIDTTGSGIKRILDQLLDHGCRALDDLARCDLVDQGIGQGFYAHLGLSRGRTF